MTKASVPVMQENFDIKALEMSFLDIQQSPAIKVGRYTF